MSKYTNYVPQPLAVYKEFYAGDRTNHNYNLCQCKGDKSTWSLILLTSNLYNSLSVPVFHIKRDHRVNDIVSVTLKSTNGFTFDLEDWAATTKDLNDPVTLDSIVFLPHTYTGITHGFGGILDPAEYYYLVISDGVETWYTEIFQVSPPSSESIYFPGGCDDDCGYINLQWAPGCILSETIHSDTAAFSIFLPVNICQPKYEYKPEKEDDGDGGQVTTFQRLEKRWEFFVYAPEYIADALTSVQMMSTVGIDFQNGDSIICRDVEVEVDWQTPCFAKITFRFTGDFLVKTACC